MSTTATDGLSALGFRVGHWTDTASRTGCTVVLCPEGATASAEVRGGAPASRELALLAPERTVAHIDAVLLTGGSAFGLAAADGVMTWLEEHGRGVPTPAGRVPIVPALGLYDLAVGSAAVRPTSAHGYTACRDASTAEGVRLGRVGAAAGATYGHWAGPDGRHPGALVAATLTAGPLLVTALVVVNALGGVDRDGTLLGAYAERVPPEAMGSTGLLANTTIGLVATNARLDKTGCLLVAQGAHDGLARAIAPPHTRMDGDAFIAAATGETTADPDAVRLLAAAAVERAVRGLAED